VYFHYRWFDANLIFFLSLPRLARCLLKNPFPLGPFLKIGLCHFHPLKFDLSKIDFCTFFLFSFLLDYLDYFFYNFIIYKFFSIKFYHYSFYCQLFSFYKFFKLLFFSRFHHSKLS
jgi:hypothetical protein